MRWLMIIKDIRMFKYPLDATQMGLDTIHGPKAKKRRRNTKIDSRRPIILTITIDFR
jgi:hypothetical protein